MGEVLAAALQKGASASGQPALTDGETAGSVLDDLSLEDARAYQQKTSAGAATNSPFFCCSAVVCSDVVVAKPEPRNTLVD